MRHSLPITLRLTPRMKQAIFDYCGEYDVADALWGGCEAIDLSMDTWENEIAKFLEAIKNEHVMVLSEPMYEIAIEVLYGCAKYAGASRYVRARFTDMYLDVFDF